MRQDDRAPFDRALRRARAAAFAAGEFVGQESFMTAGEIRALGAQAGVGPGVSVLDLCCGVAGPGRLLTRELGCDYLGVDASASAVAIARERAGDLPCRFAVAQIPPVPAGSYDVVLLLETMLAFEDKDALVRAIAAALRPAGRFAFTLEEGSPLTATERAEMPNSGTVWLTPLDELASTLERAGLVVTWQEDHSRAHRAIAAALADAFAADAEGIAAQIGRRALDELLAAHRLWMEWLDAGRVRKLALVAERRGRSASRSGPALEAEQPVLEQAGAVAVLQGVPADQRLRPHRAALDAAQQRQDGVDQPVSRAPQALQGGEVVRGDQGQPGRGGERFGLGDREQARGVPPGSYVVERGVVAVAVADVVDDDERATGAQRAGRLVEERRRRVGVHERLDRERQVEAADVARQRGEVGLREPHPSCSGPARAANRFANRTCAGLIDTPTTSTGRRRARYSAAVPTPQPRSSTRRSPGRSWSSTTAWVWCTASPRLVTPGPHSSRWIARSSPASRNFHVFAS